MNVVVQGTHVELTSLLKDFVHEKIDDALRPFGEMKDDPALKVDVELEANKGHHRKGEDVFRAEATLSVRGTVLRVEAFSDDMYNAITQMKHKLTREIRSWREKRITVARDGARSATALHADDNVSEEPFDDWIDEDGETV